MPELNPFDEVRERIVQEHVDMLRERRRHPSIPVGMAKVTKREARRMFDQMPAEQKRRFLDERGLAAVMETLEKG